MRLFFGLEIPEEVTERLTQVMNGVDCVRWQRPEQLHLTLCFLGEISQHQAADVHAVAGLVPFTPFDLMLDGVGFFGDDFKPRAVWAGIAGDAPLKALQKRLTQALTSVGVVLQERKFKPHITLGRMKGRPLLFQDYLEAHKSLSSRPFHIRNFCLYQSRMGRGGSHYEVLARYPVEQNYMVDFGNDEAYDEDYDEVFGQRVFEGRSYL